MAKTACIFGSTGLIGSCLLSVLLKDNRYDKIILFNRSKVDITDSKISLIIADYNAIDQFADQLKADEYYCCIGTTMKKAKTKQAFEFVDFQIPVSIGKLAFQNKISKLLVVSSIGASAKTGNFYLSVKGRMEEEISKIGLEKLHFFRPSMLLGKRTENRLGESIGKIIMNIFGFMFVGKLRKYRAIEAEIVAKAMVLVANGNYNNLILESDEIQNLGSLNE